MLYLDAAVLQVSLYFWNRRHNVSPHERQGSSGISGMFISMLSTPVYVSSLIATLTKRQGGFVVTSKGDTTQPDTLATFGKHLRWAAGISVPLGASLVLASDAPWMYLWSLLALIVCVLPVAIWRVEVRRRRPRRPRREPVREPVSEPASVFDGSMEIA